MAAGPRASARLVLDRSEHAGTLRQIDGADPALDRQHGIYRDGRRRPADGSEMQELHLEGAAARDGPRVWRWDRRLALSTATDHPYLVCEIMVLWRDAGCHGSSGGGCPLSF